MKIFLLTVLALSAAACEAAERRVVVQRACANAMQMSRRVVRLETGLTMVPFAVPVAVPVAVISQPAVLYAYRADVAASATLAPAKPPAATPTLGAVDVLRTRCASCHSGASAEGELAIFDDRGELVERLPRRAMLEAVEKGTMPKGLAPLTEDEVELLREWAKPPRELVY